MKYALIIIFAAYKMGGATTIDFESQEACEAGKSQIASHFSGALAREAVRLREANMLCVPKGAP